MKFGTIVTAVLASVAMVGAPATAAYARHGSAPTGRDVTYPQCGKAFPS